MAMKDECKGSLKLWAFYLMKISPCSSIKRGESEVPQWIKGCLHKRQTLYLNKSK